MSNPVFEYASQCWNRIAIRRDLESGSWCSWADRLARIGDDKAFRQKLGGHDVVYAIENDVADGYSHWVNPLFAFIRPDAQLLARGQRALSEALQHDVINLHSNGPVYFAHFCDKAKDWSLFAPSLNGKIAQGGMNILMQFGVQAAGHLATAIETYRPELVQPAISGMKEGAVSMFQRQLTIREYPAMLESMEKAPLIKQALLDDGTSQPFVGYRANYVRGLKHDVVLQAATRREGIVLHDCTAPTSVEAQPVRQVLGTWINEIVIGDAGLDQRPAVIFEGLAALARRKDPATVRMARYELREAAHIYKACRNSLLPELRQRIEKVFTSLVL